MILNVLFTSISLRNKISAQISKQARTQNIKKNHYFRQLSPFCL